MIRTPAEWFTQRRHPGNAGGIIQDRYERRRLPAIPDTLQAPFRDDGARKHSNGSRMKPSPRRLMRGLGSFARGTRLLINNCKKILLFRKEAHSMTRLCQSAVKFCRFPVFARGFSSRAIHKSQTLRQFMDARDRQEASRSRVGCCSEDYGGRDCRPASAVASADQTCYQNARPAGAGTPSMAPGRTKATTGSRIARRSWRSLTPRMVTGSALDRSS